MNVQLILNEIIYGSQVLQTRLKGLCHCPWHPETVVIWRFVDRCYLLLASCLSPSSFEQVSNQMSSLTLMWWPAETGGLHSTQVPCSSFGSIELRAIFLTKDKYLPLSDYIFPVGWNISHKCDIRKSFAFIYIMICDCHMYICILLHIGVCNYVYILYLWHIW